MGDVKSETGISVLFQVEPGHTFEEYLNHILRGKKKENGTAEAERLRGIEGSLIEEDGVYGPIKLERAAGLWLAEDTIQKPNIGLFQPDQKTTMLASVYSASERIKGDGNFGDYLIVCVDPEGSNVVVTSFATEDSNKKKNRTQRYLGKTVEIYQGSIKYLENIMSRADGALPPTDGTTRSSGSASLPRYDNKIISQQSNESNTHAEITGPALQKRGEGWGSGQWSDKDYSVERDYATTAPAPATPVQNEADKKRALTRISDIMNKLRKIRPVRQGVDAPKSVLDYTDQQKQIARHRWAGDWKTAGHEIGHIVDYKLGLRDRVANSAQLTAIQQELEALGVNTSSSSPYLRKPSSAERYPIVHVRRMARA